MTTDHMPKTPEEWAQQISDTFVNTVLKWMVENGECGKDHIYVPESVGAPLQHLIVCIQEQASANKAGGVKSHKCPLGKDCDMTIAYLKGVEDGKDAVRKVSTNLEGAIKQVRDFAEVLDEEGMDRDGLHIAIYAILDEVERMKK